MTTNDIESCAGDLQRLKSLLNGVSLRFENVPEDMDTRLIIATANEMQLLLQLAFNETKEIIEGKKRVNGLNDQLLIERKQTQEKTKDLNKAETMADDAYKEWREKSDACDAMQREYKEKQVVIEAKQKEYEGKQAACEALQKEYEVKRVACEAKQLEYTIKVKELEDKKQPKLDDLTALLDAVNVSPEGLAAVKSNTARMETAIHSLVTIAELTTERDQLRKDLETSQGKIQEYEGFKGQCETLTSDLEKLRTSNEKTLGMCATFKQEILDLNRNIENIRGQRDGFMKMLDEAKEQVKELEASRPGVIKEAVKEIEGRCRTEIESERKLRLDAERAVRETHEMYGRLGMSGRVPVSPAMSHADPLADMGIAGQSDDPFVRKRTSDARSPDKPSGQDAGESNFQKKRRVEHKDKTWDDLETTLRVLVPHGKFDRYVARDEISKCFPNEKSLHRFISYVKGEVDIEGQWRCLMTITALGAHKATAMTGARKCTLCSNAVDLCLQVQHKGDIVWFQLENIKS